MLNSSARRAALLGASAAVVIGVAALTGACGARPTATIGEPVIVPQATATTSVSVPAPQPKPDPKDAPPVNSPKDSGSPLDPQNVLAAAVQVEPNTTLGAVVFDTVTNKELLVIEPDRQFRSASLVKLLIAIDALDQGVGSDERKLIWRMLSLSDDAIASQLWVRHGGPELVTRAATLIGLQNTEPPEKYGRWGETKVTAHDMVRVYQYVMTALPPEDHTLIVDALGQAPEHAADDFRQYFGIPDGLNAQWAIKQGWGNNDHSMVLHSTGLVGAKWRYVVVLLTEHPLGSGWRTCSQSVTAAAGALDGQLPGA
ncbi:serine hydrolase [Actinophytocola oryzae]|uniref:Beta-lactamase class A catalytic domain-containing protein n=1 Tax=Actinophytocola oryzae TaxID=502181 RepID=A0A4R7VSL6_9PSEU|nr:serine hydrolase [Actinophytocola oryzae]TDV52217.1 hypothetical protein CLV71_105349 [Actinophytocola oryzae]